MKKVHISPLKDISRSMTVPGDKSVSHRAVIIGSIAKGVTKIKNFLEAEDTLNTIKVYKSLGVKIEKKKDGYYVRGRGINALREPSKTLYVGNSGTAIRLSLGVLAAQQFVSVITGDAQIIKRPMKRVMVPISKMGAKFESNKGYAPVTVHGAVLNGISYSMPVASAQVKSSIMLAALHALKATEITEPVKSRDHTERLLGFFGADIKISGKKIRLRPGRELKGRTVFVPGDISSAAYFIVAGLICPNSKITIKDVGLNPTRTGIIDVLKKMGGRIQIKNMREKNNEPVGDIVVSTSKLKGTVIKGSIIPKLIDEIPVIAVAAAYAKGNTTIKDAKELRVKETDRIATITKNLARVGIGFTEKSDGMIIRGNGGKPLKYGDIDSFGDHRIAMSFAVAALASDNGLLIKNVECVNTSFPQFFRLLEGLKRKR